MHSMLFYFILLYPIPSCRTSGRTDWQSPVRAEQIRHNLLYDVSMLLFSWFEM